MTTRTKIRNLAAVVLVWAVAPAAHALSLGEPLVSSSLGHPLVAQVPIVTGANERVATDRMTVRLAGPDQHARSGLEYPSALVGMRVQIKRVGGKRVVSLTTVDRVAEPLLNFLIELSWPRGQLFKEVAIFLDPVNLARPAEATAATATVSTKQQPARTTRRKARAAPFNKDTRGYGPVLGGQTLSGIAGQMRRGTGLSLQDVMQAIYQANPQAFGGSVDILQKGALLKIPTPQEMQSLAGGETAPASEQQLLAETDPEPAPEPAAESTPAVPEQTPTSDDGAPRLSIMGDTPTVQVGEQPVSPAIELPQVEGSDQTSVLRNRLQDTEVELQVMREANRDMQALMTEMKEELDATRNRLRQVQSDYQKLSEQPLAPEAPAVAIDQQSPMDELQAFLANPSWVPWLIGILAAGSLGGLLLIMLLRRRNRRYWEERQYESPGNFNANTDKPTPSLRTVAPLAMEIEPATVEVAATTAIMPDSAADSRPTEEVTTGPDTGPGKERMKEALTSGEYNLADTKVHQEIINAEGNDEAKLLLLTFYKAIGRHEEMGQLATQILEHLPQEENETREQVLSICRNVVELDGNDGAVDEPGAESTLVTGDDDDKTALLGPLPAAVVGLADTEASTILDPPEGDDDGSQADLPRTVAYDMDEPADAGPATNSLDIDGPVGTGTMAEDFWDSGEAVPRKNTRKDAEEEYAPIEFDLEDEDPAGADSDHEDDDSDQTAIFIWDDEGDGDAPTEANPLDDDEEVDPRSTSGKTTRF